MIENMLSANPNLFKGEKPSELLPETYYAYLDTIEQIDNEFHIQFDCVVKKVIDETQISSETLMDLPSIIISTKVLLVILKVFLIIEVYTNFKANGW